MTVYRLSQILVRPLAWLAAAIALWPLMGHFLRSERMFGVFTDSYKTHEMTSILVLLLSFAVQMRRRDLRVANLLAALCLGIVIARFIPQFGPVFGVGGPYMMGWNTALVLGMIAAGFLISEARFHSVGALLCFLAMGLTVILMIAGIWQQHEILGQMSLPTAMMTAALAGSIAAIHANRGVMRVLLGPYASGRNARMQLFLGILTPLVLGGLFMRVPDWLEGQSEVFLLIAALTGFNIALIVVTAMVMERADHKRRQLERMMSDLALRDGLTKVFNRVMLERRFVRAVAQAEDGSVPFSMLMIDLDRFKSINDLGGHELGDRVLSHVARALRLEMRWDDTLARVGGEEFAVILPGATLVDSYEIAKRLRACIEDVRVAREDGSVQRVTASIGVAQWIAGESMHEIYARTDGALYEAKKLGRNRVLLATGQGFGERIDRMGELVSDAPFPPSAEAVCGRPVSDRCLA
ncbi:GGDEF domain-containing protein [Thioclava sp. 15-R06ZXC-3]|uniref:diguanylate cyclase n=1 Tax=Thioclava arctica TaxID=3238301 RepID=A0ABV3TJQ2_9RHOB